MSTPEPVKSASRFAPFSLLAALIAWILLYSSGRVTDISFNDVTSNAMVILLWLSAAVTIGGLVLAILALRARAANRGIALLGAVLNIGTLLVLIFLGLVAVLLS